VACDLGNVLAGEACGNDLRSCFGHLGAKLAQHASRGSCKREYALLDFCGTDLEHEIHGGFHGVKKRVGQAAALVLLCLRAELRRAVVKVIDIAPVMMAAPSNDAGPEPGAEFG